MAGGGEVFNIKIWKRTAIASLALAILCSAFYFFAMRPRRVVPILMYHSISNQKGSSLHVSPENFSRQMMFLSKSGYSVITLDKLVEHSKSGTRFIPRTVVVTFDDGLKDNYINAFPVLSKYNIPATIFLITDYMGTRPTYLNWDQVRLMAENGIDFGGHTRSNVYLPTVKNPGLLRDEIAGCKEDIELNTGMAAQYFCYPTGGFNEEIKEVVRKAGYKGACTTNRGYDKSNLDIYELNRVKITNSDTTKPFSYRAKLSGYYNVFRKFRKGD